MNNTINFILFQLLWISCIFGVAHQHIIPAILIAMTMICYHSLPKVRKKGDLKLVIICLSLGFVLDTILAYWQLIDYFYDFGHDYIAPFWIVLLWMGFALTLNHSMSWMFKNMAVAYAFVAIGPVISYLSAQKIGAIVINNTPFTLITTSVMWLMVFSVILLTKNMAMPEKKYAYR